MRQKSITPDRIQSRTISAAGGAVCHGLLRLRPGVAAPRPIRFGMRNGARDLAMPGPGRNAASTGGSPLSFVPPVATTVPQTEPFAAAIGEPIRIRGDITSIHILLEV